MNVNDFYQNLCVQLQLFTGSLSDDSLAPIRNEFQNFRDEFSGGKSTREETIKCLFDLSVFVQQQSSALHVPTLAETFASLISKKIEEISSAAQQKTSPSIPLSCAGLRNRSNRCYVYACFKGLWGSQKFREIIERKALAIKEQLKIGQEDDAQRRLTALYLHRLFLTFDATSPSEIIEQEDKAIQSVLQEMAKYHPSIADGKQQDSTEFLHWLFDDLFDSGEYLFSYVERKRRPSELMVDFCIPNIDIPETTTGNLFIIQLPSQEEAQADTQAAFEPTIVEEAIDDESVLTSEHNKEKDSGKIFDTLSRMPKKVHVLKTKLFQGEPPPCLFVHLWRQIKEVDVPVENLKEGLEPQTISSLHLTDEEISKLWGQKMRVVVPVQVKIPTTLFLHHVDRSQMEYAIKGVIVHSGLADSGHYYAYLPVEGTSSTCSGISEESASPAEELLSISSPTLQKKEDCSHALSCVRHDDHRVFTVPYDQRLQRELEQEGYILVYDRK